MTPETERQARTGPTPHHQGLALGKITETPTSGESKIRLRLVKGKRSPPQGKDPENPRTRRRDYPTPPEQPMQKLRVLQGEEPTTMQVEQEGPELPPDMLETPPREDSHSSSSDGGGTFSSTTETTESQWYEHEHDHAQHQHATLPVEEQRYNWENPSGSRNPYAGYKELTAAADGGQLQQQQWQGEECLGGRGRRPLRTLTMYE